MRWQSSPSGWTSRSARCTVADWHTWSTDPNDPGSSEIESLIRAAGGYVGASDDLRPRVLEAARLQRHERRAQRWLRRSAVAVLLIAMVGSVLRPEEVRRARPIGIV